MLAVVFHRHHLSSWRSSLDVFLIYLQDIIYRQFTYHLASRSSLYMGNQTCTEEPKHCNPLSLNLWEIPGLQWAYGQSAQLGGKSIVLKVAWQILRIGTGGYDLTRVLLASEFNKHANIPVESSEESISSPSHSQLEPSYK